MKHYKYILFSLGFLFFSNCVLGQIRFVSIKEIKEKANLVEKIGKKRIVNDKFLGDYKISINARLGYESILILAYELGDGEINLKKIDSIAGNDKGEVLVSNFFKGRNKETISLKPNGQVDFSPIRKTDNGQVIEYSWTLLKGGKVVKIESKSFNKNTQTYFLEKHTDNIYICYLKVGLLPFYKEKGSGLLEDFYFEFGVFRKL